MDLISIRKQLHAMPELAFEEHQTQALLLSLLRELPGIVIHRFEGITGILVEYSHGSGAYKLFRADMDALPVNENTGCAFVSGTPGMMHACGHDIHMTVLLGLIQKVVNEEPQDNLLFLFQPAEEGKGGAEAVLAQGLIQKFEIQSVSALHVASGLPVGTISSRAGIFFSIPQEFDVVFKGKSAHAAYPEQGIDALSAALTFITLMNSDMEDLKAEHPVIFHIGRMTAGRIRNVVPDEAVIEGTHRSLEKSSRDAMNRFIRENSALAAAQTGAEATVDLLCSYDPVVNDEALVEQLQAVCNKLQLPFIQADPAMTGEDFGFFTSLYPGLLFWLGSSSDAPLHSDQFLPDEKCIEGGINVFYSLI
ncbi:MAG TPA: amidohydrolase [Candidatus Cloacimonadota bacterium]|nr:amidohydrolase [Candidatus Cloacimonadota bacterium]